MASSGTVTTPVIEARIRPHEEREGVILMGHTQIKSTATIEAGDLTLRTIKTIVLTPFDGPVRSGGPAVLYGSVSVAGSLMNSMRIRSFRGSIVPHTGTQHVGTTQGGTMKVGFFIAGA